MASFEVILNYMPTGKDPVLRSVTVEDTTRPLAIPLGIDELLAWCASETPVPIPQAAIDWWPVAKRSAYPLSEILTRLEGEWGVTFEIKDAAAANGAVPETPSRHANPPRNGALAPPNRQNGTAPPLDNLANILSARLEQLQARDKIVTAQMEQARDDYRYIQEQIEETMSAITALSVKKKGRPKKEIRADG
jgi:hypothetical protein